MPTYEIPSGAPQPDPRPVKVTPQIADEPYRSAIVDTTVTPYSQLITNISGSLITGEYYSQVLGASQAPGPFNPSTDVSYQQYRHIHKMDAKLSGTLQPSVDPQTQQATLSGTVVMFPFIKPNAGDVWVLNIGDGRLGVFTVKSPKTLSLYTQTCYECEITLYMYLSAAIQQNLDDKTVEHLYYNRDALLYNNYPILTTQESQNQKTSVTYSKELIRLYFSKFFSNMYSTFLVPDQYRVTYDPYVVDFISRMLTADDHRLITRLRTLITDDYRYSIRDCIWYALLTRDYSYIDSGFTDAWLVPVTAFTNNPAMMGIRFSGVEMVVVPKTQVGFDVVNSLQLPAGIGFRNDNPTLVGVGGMDVPVVGADDRYVLSEAFYEQTPPLTGLESLVHSYLNGEQINRQQLFAYAEACKDWGLLEQFYFMPILICLLRISERELQ